MNISVNSMGVVIRYGLATAMVSVVFAAGCAPASHSFEDDGAYDPIEPVNRVVYGFNKKVDAWTLRPVAIVYEKLPSYVRSGVSNFLYNLSEGNHVINRLLQGEGNEAATAAARFAVNTLIGVGGLVDVAEKGGFSKNPTGFGDTFRIYTGHGGAYLVLPLLGPSSVADASGRIGDIAASPSTYVSSPGIRYGLSGLGAVSARAGVLQYEDLLESALDEYSYVRDSRETLRRKITPDREDREISSSYI